ncbi:MAG: hypothetical protein D6733_05765, partial [Methanobacteriota archaeon]
MASEEKKVFKAISRLKDRWYGIGDSIEGLPRFNETVDEEFISFLKEVFKNAQGARSDLEEVSQELRGMLSGKSGAINKVYREARPGVDTLVEQLQEYVETLERIKAYSKELPALQKEHKALAEALKKRAAQYEKRKEEYEGLKRVYEERQSKVLEAFESENAQILGSFKDALAPIVEGCRIKVSGSALSLEELYELAVVDGADEKVVLEPISVKGLRGVLSGKESTELKSRLDFVRMQIRESRERYEQISEERFQREEDILREFSQMPGLHGELVEMEEEIKGEKAREEELQRQISERRDFTSKKSRFTGKDGVLHMRDSLLETYNSAHANVRSFLDFCKKNLEGFEFQQKDIEKRELQASVKELEARVAELTGERDSLRSHVRKLEKDLKETAFTVEKLEKELEARTASLEESQAAAEQLKEELKSLGESYDAIRLESEERAREIEKLAPLVDIRKELEVEVAALKKDVKEKTGHIKALEGENADLKAEVALLKKLGEENTGLKGEIKQLKQGLSEKEAALSATSEKLASQTSQSAKLQKELEESRIHNKELSKEVKEKSSRIQVLEDEAEKLRAEVALLKKLGEENTELKGELKRLSEALVKTESDLAATSEKLANETSLRMKLEGEQKESRVRVSA